MSEKKKSRYETAQSIKASPGNFKVCESCGSIVVVKATMCPNCSGYRFDTSKVTVIYQAELLGSRDPLSIESKDYL